MLATTPANIDPAKARKFFEDKMAFTTGPVELARELGDDNVLVVDVRAAEDYNKGHIPGAISLPQERWDDTDQLNKNKLHVLYCYSQVCHLAAKAAMKLAAKGYSVMELEGGFAGWEEHGQRVES
jgi:rhodanese-related sulfurtransferase